jgi:hypothetical protein
MRCQSRSPLAVRWFAHQTGRRSCGLLFVRKGRKGRKESQSVSCHEATHQPSNTDLLASLSFASFASFADKGFCAAVQGIFGESCSA